MSMQLFHDEDEITLDQTRQVARILAAFDCMTAPQLQILAQGGRLLDDLNIDLWRSARDYPAIDDFFCHIENTTRLIATHHRDLGAITGDQIFLTALAVQAAAISVLMVLHNTHTTNELLNAAWLRATLS
jgi:hypothetical protein